MEKRKESRVKEEAACVHCFQGRVDTSFQGHVDRSRKRKAALTQRAAETPGSS